MTGDEQESCGDFPALAPPFTVSQPLSADAPLSSEADGFSIGHHKAEAIVDSMQYTSRKVGAAAALVLLCIGATGALADDVDDYISNQMAQQHIPGLSLAVVKDGKPIKLQSYGLANVELNVAATPQTIFKIGSVSKQFIATGVMLLVNDGKVALNDPIGKYLEGAPESWKDITVQHLLTHTSGIVREAPGFDALKLQSDADLIRTAYPLPLRFKPGEKFEYCNVGYFILAEIIHKVAGQEWPVFMEERVFKPLGMNATRATDVTALVPNRADGYAFKAGQLQNAATILALRPSGAFLSNTVDLVKWNAALDSASILPRPLLDLMWTPCKLNDDATRPYGLGWTLDAVGTHRRVHHGGSLPGFRSEYTRWVDDGLSVIVLANGDDAKTDAIALKVAAHYIPNLVPTVPRDPS